MSCVLCGCGRVWHGSSVAPAGTCLNESGCHDGVLMDDDVYAEGWQTDVAYPPCPNNPNRCETCGGTGQAPDDVTDRDDCPECFGNGWAGGKARWPVAAKPKRDVYVAIMRAAKKGNGLRLTADEVFDLSMDDAISTVASNVLQPEQRARALATTNGGGDAG